MKQSNGLISLVPEGDEHKVEGERKYIFPAISLEILTTRMIELTAWELEGLNDPFWRLYIPSLGQADVVIQLENRPAEKAKLKVGNAYLIPPHTTIYSRIDEPFAKWYVHFSLGQRGDRATPGLYPIEYSAEMKNSIRKLSNSPKMVFPWHSARLVSEALEQLPQTTWKQPKIDPRLELAMDFMYQNLIRKISAEEIAAAAGLSVRNLNHLFKVQLNTSPKNVLIEFRLNQACRLLRHTDQTVDQIAENCGFPNRYYFSRIMKQVRSISPAAYRRSR